MKPNLYRLLIVPLAILFACNPKPVGLEPFAPLDALLVLPLSVNMLTGTTAQLGAQRFKDGTGTDKTAAATWMSNDTNVVTVSSKGLLTAVNPGRTTVKGTVEGASATVQVIVEAPGLQLLPQTIFLEYRPALTRNPDGGLPVADFPRVTTSDTFTANLLLEDGGRINVADRMIWGSSNPGAATVEDGGVVTSTGVGDAVITGILDGEAVTANVSVSRKPNPLADGGEVP
jgi:uncharacterized protein YjdB